MQTVTEHVKPAPSLRQLAREAKLTPIGTLSGGELVVRCSDQGKHRLVVLAQETAGAIDVMAPFAPTNTRVDTPPPDSAETADPTDSAEAAETTVVEKRGGRWSVRERMKASQLRDAALRVRALMGKVVAQPGAKPGTAAWCRAVALSTGVVVTRDGAVVVETVSGSPQVYNDGGYTYALGAPKKSFASCDGYGIVTAIFRCGKAIVVATPEGTGIFEWWHEHLSTALRPGETIICLPIFLTKSRRKRLSPSKRSRCFDSIPESLLPEGLRELDGLSRLAPGRGGSTEENEAAEVGSGQWAHALAQRKGRFDPDDGSIHLQVGRNLRAWFNLGGKFGAAEVPTNAFGHSDGENHMVYVRRHRGRVEVASTAGHRDPAVRMFLGWLTEAGVARREVRVRQLGGSRPANTPPWKGSSRVKVEVREDL